MLVGIADRRRLHENSASGEIHLRRGIGDLMIEDSVLVLTKADVRRKQEENQGREFEKEKRIIGD